MLENTEYISRKLMTERGLISRESRWQEGTEPDGVLQEWVGVALTGTRSRTHTTFGISQTGASKVPGRLHQKER